MPHGRIAKGLQNSKGLPLHSMQEMLVVSLDFLPCLFTLKKRPHCKKINALLLYVEDVSLMLENKLNIVLIYCTYYKNKCI